MIVIIHNNRFRLVIYLTYPKMSLDGAKDPNDDIEYSIE